MELAISGISLSTSQCFFNKEAIIEQKHSMAI
jgi:hypothetical protein